MLTNSLLYLDSFTTTPGGGESDLRTLYCAFAISAMLDDWSGVDVERAKSFVASCRVCAQNYAYRRPWLKFRVTDV